MMRLAELVASHSDRRDPRKASQRTEHAPCVVKIARAPGRERIPTKLVYMQCARFDLLDVSALGGILDEAINPVGSRPELNRSDRECRNPLIAVEQVTRYVPIDVRPRLIGESVQVIDIISSQCNVEGVIDQSGLAVLDIFGQMCGTIQDRLADRCERQLVEFFALDRLTKVFPRLPGLLSKFVRGINASLRHAILVP
jgi:hypothetical protein